MYDQEKHEILTFEKPEPAIKTDADKFDVY